jgi:predicted RNase H-like nuclease (RuvC/YqgF family)
MSQFDSHDAEREIHSLKETINALRDALEFKESEGARLLQELRQASHDHTKQLESTVDRMRARLEEESQARDSQIQQETQFLKEQLEQSRQTIIALRAQLEAKKI